jgi:hypothetical protein
VVVETMRKVLSFSPFLIVLSQRRRRRNCVRTSNETMRKVSGSHCIALFSSSSVVGGGRGRGRDTV